MIRTYFKFSAVIAPIKASILPLMNQEVMIKYIPQIRENLMLHNISSTLDDSSQAIGRRYARTDEVGIPFGITIDF